MITDLVQIKRLGEQKRGENERLRRHLKTYRYQERRLVKLAGEVENEIDCRECGNCCRVATARITSRDVSKLSKFLGLPFQDFVRKYTVEDHDEGHILKRDPEKGCVFLEGNLCTVYEARPNSCDEFPHVTSNKGSVTARMWEFIDRATYCPIVYNTLEAWKGEVEFER